MNDHRPEIPVPMRSPITGWARRLAFVVVLTGLGLAVGCRGGDGKQEDKRLAEVWISAPVVKDDALDFEEFTGQIEPLKIVSVVPRATGYILKAPFKEGDKVKKGETLFVIDPQPYEADLKRTEADKLQKKAQLAQAAADWERAQNLKKEGGIAKAEYDQFEAAYEVAKANVSVSEAQRKIAELNLSYCTIKAEFDGVVSRIFPAAYPGNVVKADDPTAVLTTLIPIDPVYAYFNVDEQTVLKMLRLVEKGEFKRIEDTARKVKIWLGDQDKHNSKPIVGDLDFVNNKTDPATGTLLARGVFRNPDGMLKPGLFCSVRLDVGKPHRAILVSERAIGNDQGQKYVFVIKDIVKKDEKTQEGKTEYRKVRLGSLQGGLRVIEDAVVKDGKVVEGLLPGEMIAVTGVQKIRSNQDVLIGKVQPMSMLTPLQRPVNVQSPGAAKAPAPAGH